jgi:hypothetical protein
MHRLCRILALAFPALLALGLLGGFPDSTQAAGIAFHNELKTPVIVQGASNVNNVLRRWPPLTILPGKMDWDTHLPPGKRLIVIYDAQMRNRPLLQQVIQFQGQDMHLYIVPAGAGRVMISDRPPTK